jgi:hypothetical protein
VATPDPYQHWAGAPKHWVNVPAQRQSPPSPDELDAAAREPNAGTGRPFRGEWTVATIALAVAVAAFVLIGSGSALPDDELSPPERTNGSSVR